MGKYTWSFDKDADLWQNALSATVEECLEDARNVVRGAQDADPTFLPPRVYVGEAVEYIPHVDAVSVLELMESDAYDFCSISDEWNPISSAKANELEELTEQITATVKAWLKKYGHEPNFHGIEDIKSYPLFGEVMK